jgi:hypothetical protein
MIEILFFKKIKLNPDIDWVLFYFIRNPSWEMFKTLRIIILIVIASTAKDAIQTVLGGELANDRRVDA